jgi:hypothetical protein
MPDEPVRRRPERLGLVHTNSLKRRGAVRGNSMPRPDSARSFLTDSVATPRTASFSYYRMTDLPEILTRAETWAATDEHRRIRQRRHPSGSGWMHAGP